VPCGCGGSSPTPRGFALLLGSIDVSGVLAFEIIRGVIEIQHPAGGEDLAPCLVVIMPWLAGIGRHRQYAQGNAHRPGEKPVVHVVSYFVRAGAPLRGCARGNRCPVALVKGRTAAAHVGKNLTVISIIFIDVLGTKFN
jgi:hypothetical protein